MFTLEQIKEAQDKVQTAAAFSNYIKEVIQLGVQGYDTFINDGRVSYHGIANFSVTTTEKYPTLKIAPDVNKERFIEFLVLHQDGQTDYYTFCQQAAQCGIAKSRVALLEMTCTYFDILDAPIIIEKIPV